MWIFTKDGFYSVVQKPGEQELTVRARVRADLERLKILYLPKLSDIIETADSDYRYRANTTHAAFADALYHIAQDIEYPNFKKAVSKQRGSDRAKVYAAVWASTLSLNGLDDHVSKEDEAEIPRLSPLSMSQRLMMRALYHIHLYEAMRTWRCMPFYATAEKLGLAGRESNEHNISPEDYAKALIRDGIEKGWVKKPLSLDEWYEVFTVFVYRFLKDGATFRSGEPWIEQEMGS